MKGILALSPSIIKEQGKSIPHLHTKRNSSFVSVPLWLLPALPHIPLVLFSPWGLQPSQASLRCFSGHRQPPQRCPAQPQYCIGSNTPSLSRRSSTSLVSQFFVSTCTQRQKITHIVLLEVFFCKGFLFCCPLALSQHIAQCFLYYKKVCIRQEEKKNFSGG